MFLFIVVLAVGIFISPKYLKKNHSSVEIQSLVVTFGIVGTFFGLFVGLLQFDINNLEAGIGAILSGLRFAFLTPIAGISASIILRIYPKFYGILEEKESVEDKLNDRDVLLAIKEEMMKINKNISGGEDTTILSQIQKIRIGMLDKQEELNQSFKKFATDMADNNSKALIEALERVMREFNTKISEQFGENFKHLNQGVGKMLEFQENYKNQIEVSTNALNKAGEAIEISVSSIDALVKKSEVFLAVSQKLERTVTDLKTGLENLDQVAKNSKESSVAIQESIISLRDNFITTANAIIEDNNKQVERLRINLSTLSESLSKQVVSLDQQLGEELKKSITGLGSQLASLSSKFVDDYSLLANKLSEVFTLLNK